MIKITDALVIVVNFYSRDYYMLTLRDAHVSPTYARFNTLTPVTSKLA